MSSGVIQPPPPTPLSSFPEPLVAPPTVLALQEGPISGVRSLLFSQGRAPPMKGQAAGPASRNHTPRAPSHLRLPRPHTCSPALSVLFWLTPQLHLNPPCSTCLRAFELADWADSYSSFLPQLRCHLLLRRNRRAKSLHFSSCFFVSLHPST